MCTKYAHVSSEQIKRFENRENKIQRLMSLIVANIIKTGDIFRFKAQRYAINFGNLFVQTKPLENICVSRYSLLTPMSIIVSTSSSLKSKQILFDEPFIFNIDFKTFTY